MDETTYSFDRDFLERALSIFVQDRDFLLGYRKAVSHTYFKDEDLFTVAQAILSAFDKHTTVPDEVALRHLLKRKLEGSKSAIDLGELYDLVGRIYSFDLAGCKDIVLTDVLEFGKVQGFANGIRGALGLIPFRKYDEALQSIVDGYEVDTNRLDSGNFHRNTIRARMAWRKRTADGLVRTGIRALDQGLGGGLAGKQLTVILGGTSVGKTTACVVFACGAVKQNVPVLFFSLELDEFRIGDKIDSNLSGIKTNMLVGSEKQLKKKLAEHYRSVHSDIYVSWHEPLTASIHDLRAEYIQIKRTRNFDPGLIIIDTPDLCKPLIHRKQKHEWLEDTYTALFAWAGKDNVPIVVTSDIKAEFMDQACITRNMAGGSYEKVKKADNVIGLGQSIEMRQKDVDDGHFKIFVNFDKVRSGEAGKLLETKVYPETASWFPVGLVGIDEVKKK